MCETNTQNCGKYCQTGVVEFYCRSVIIRLQKLCPVPIGSDYRFAAGVILIFFQYRFMCVVLYGTARAAFCRSHHRAGGKNNRYADAEDSKDSGKYHCDRAIFKCAYHVISCNTTSVRLIPF